MEFLYLRPAAMEDRQLLFDWRNDPLVRQNSFTTDPIPWEDHVKWFARMMADPQTRQYILIAAEAEDTGVPVGQIRLNACEENPSAYEISYSVAAEARGRGYGRRLLETIKGKAPQDLPRIRTLIGRVKKDNPASAAAFRAAGYSCEETESCYVFTFFIFR